MWELELVRERFGYHSALFIASSGIAPSVVAVFQEMVSFLSSYNHFIFKTTTTTTTTELVILKFKRKNAHFSFL